MFAESKDKANATDMGCCSLMQQAQHKRGLPQRLNLGTI
jgi:hypothetical protein